MAIPKIDKLSLDELKALQKQVVKAIDEFEVNQRKEALAAVEAKAKEFGFSLSELTSKTKSKPKASPPKYRHPENAALTWSGRGRKPAWIKEGLEAGRSLDDYAI
ncbi:H-NS histone family protein [Salipiger thiooxidans]|uniref:H-NS histone family protein n=1 Tax=Salipiger thiooxidans TaxID=282683 RepID=UPI001CFA350B|nr:H-NS histone family protein [Salipiger thiooxidans]